MKVRITRDHDYRHAPARVQAFLAGSEVNVPKAVAEALIAAGAAHPIEPASKAINRAQEE